MLVSGIVLKTHIAMNCVFGIAFSAFQKMNRQNLEVVRDSVYD